LHHRAPWCASPLDLEFVDEEGGRAAVGLLRPVTPVILTLNYYRCPMLCGLLLNGLLQGLKELPWTPGQEFEIVTVSIDPPRRRPSQAQEAELHDEYERPARRPGGTS